MTFLFDVADAARGRFCDKIAGTMLQNIHRVELFATCWRYLGTWLHVQQHLTSVAEQL